MGWTLPAPIRQAEDTVFPVTLTRRYRPIMVGCADLAVDERIPQEEPTFRTWEPMASRSRTSVTAKIATTVVPVAVSQTAVHMLMVIGAHRSDCA